MDDILVFSKNARVIIGELKNRYILKGIGEPEYYLGADVELLNHEWQKEGITSALSSKIYIECVTECFELLDSGNPLPSPHTPMTSTHHPELDMTPFASELDATKYCGMVSSCDWLITLGCFDINYAVNMLSCYSQQPHEGHIKAI